MRKHIKNYFVPHEGNDHKPHMLREASVLVLASVAIVILALSALQSTLLLRSTDFLAAVLPDVLVDLANEDRLDNDLPPLKENETLKKAAQLKADDMAANGYFAHVSPEGITPWHWFVEAGYQFTYAGENLAVNFSDSQDVEQAWMNSTGHRANILGDQFTEIGIATALGEYKGEETVFVVQMFGAPAALPPAPIVPETLAQVVEEPTLEPEVASEETGPPSEEVPVVEIPVVETPVEQTLEIITEDENFIAVGTPSASEVTPTEEAAGAEATGLVEPQSTVWQRLFTQPHQLLAWLYIIFAGILVIVLTAMVLIEIEKQHPRNVLYGLLLLALLLVLVYISRDVIFGGLLIV